MSAGASTDAPVLEVRDLVTQFVVEGRTLVAVDGVSFTVPRGKTVGLVGESGCGKSVTALSILRLLPEPPAKIAAGKVLFRGDDLLLKTEPEMRKIRGNAVSMIFQEPMTSLNPVYTAGEQVMESLRLHRGMSASQARTRAVDLFRRVGIPSPEERVDAYPHQLSGGMRQRVMIAMALACDPALLIADEPTTALDVTIQAQILEILRQLQTDLGMAILLITHDLGVVAETCDEVVVMYAGRVVERGRTAALFEHTLHPYTWGLLGSMPSSEAPKESLREIPGMVPALGTWAPGCKFQDRCPRVQPRCRDEEPGLTTPLGDDHQVRCHFPHTEPQSVEQP